MLFFDQGTTLSCTMLVPLIMCLNVSDFSIGMTQINDIKLWFVELKQQFEKKLFKSNEHIVNNFI